MQGDGAPTIQVGQAAAAMPSGSSAGTGGEDSMVEKVGNIVDGKPEAEAAVQGRTDQPNPKKRMWEEPVEQEKHKERERPEIKDEL